MATHCHRKLEHTGSKSSPQEPVCPMSLLSLLLGVHHPLSSTVLVRPNLNPNIAGIAKQEQAGQCTHSSVLPTQWSRLQWHWTHYQGSQRRNRETSKNLIKWDTWLRVLSDVSQFMKAQKVLSQRSHCLTLFSNHLCLLVQANSHHSSNSRPGFTWN